MCCWTIVDEKGVFLLYFLVYVKYSLPKQTGAVTPLHRFVFVRSISVVISG